VLCIVVSAPVPYSLASVSTSLKSPDRTTLSALPNASVAVPSSLATPGYGEHGEAAHQRDWSVCRDSRGLVDERKLAHHPVRILGALLDTLRNGANLCFERQRRIARTSKPPGVRPRKLTVCFPRSRHLAEIQCLMLQASSPRHSVSREAEQWQIKVSGVCTTPLSATAPSMCSPGVSSCATRHLTSFWMLYIARAKKHFSSNYVKGAFRLVEVRPADLHLIGKFAHDRVLPLICKCARLR